MSLKGRVPGEFNVNSPRGSQERKHQKSLMDAEVENVLSVGGTEMPIYIQIFQKRI